MNDGYRLFVNTDRTVLLRIWQDKSGLVEIALRDSPDRIWRPPITLKEEKT